MTGKEMVHLITRQDRRAGDRRDLGCKVERRLGATDDHHPPAGEAIRRPVVARMHQRAVEAPGQIGRRHLPIVAARDHQPIKALGVPAPHRDLPRVPCEPHALHRSAEADVTPQVLRGRV